MASFDGLQRQTSPVACQSTSSDMNRSISKESSSLSSHASERPSSALARGVQIVEYDNSAVTRLNPRPVINAVDESVVLLEEYLCPRKLVRLCADDVVRTTHLFCHSSVVVLMPVSLITAAILTYRACQNFLLCLEWFMPKFQLCRC